MLEELIILQGVRFCDLQAAKQFVIVIDPLSPCTAAVLGVVNFLGYS
jgi:hypothetical protein